MTPSKSDGFDVYFAYLVMLKNSRIVEFWKFEKLISGGDMVVGMHFMGFWE